MSFQIVLFSTHLPLFHRILRKSSFTLVPPIYVMATPEQKRQQTLHYVGDHAKGQQQYQQT